MTGLFGHWASSGKAAIVAAMIGVGGLGCQPRIGPYHPEAIADTSGRVVPLRFVVLTQCDRCRDCRKSCRQGPPEQNLRDSVAAANETFAPTGLRFEIEAVERVEAPDWWKHGATPVKRTWRAIRGEAQRVFPWVPGDAWKDPNEVKPTNRWLECLSAAYSRPHEISVFVQSGNSRAETSFPNGGRGIWASDGTFGSGSSRGGASNMLFLFAHELGHYFGLRHTFAHAGTNPVDGKPWRLADRWDLVYHPGSGPGDPHRFFSSREEAAQYADGDLWLIEQHDREGSNCAEGADGSLTCELPGRNGYSETHHSGEDALKGLSMPLRPHENRYYRWARNATAYGNMAIPRRLSTSQIEMVRTFLRHPMMIGGEAMSQMGRLPDGIDALPSYRTTVGRIHAVGRPNPP